MSKILLIDDEPMVLHSLGRLLENAGHHCESAFNAPEAMERLAGEPYELALSDVNMPGESGIELAKQMSLQHPDVALVMVTGVDDPKVGELAMDLGAFGYLIKPFKPNEILIMVSNALRRRKLEIERRQHMALLEQTVEQRTIDLRQVIVNLEQSRRKVQQSREEMIHRLARAAEFRDNDTGQHLQRMSQYCHLIAQRMGLAAERCELIRITSLMHDVGKIGIPDAILFKPDRLTEEEFTVMQMHAEIGFKILSESQEPTLSMAADIAFMHHEKVDGSGYPRQLRGEEISLEGRIAAVADVFDAVSTVRIYRDAMPRNQALDIIKQGRGTHFDADVVDCFFDSLYEVFQVMATYSDRLLPFSAMS